MHPSLRSGPRTLFQKVLLLCVVAAGGTMTSSALTVADASHEGTYTIRVDQPQQVIKGLGFEIQSDSIGSGNAGMPDTVIAVPHDLTPAERKRFYHEMLHGFRYARLAMGLYLRGTDAEQKHIIERYPGQMNDLRQMQDESGIEGFDVEYWSPAPFWKKNKTYYGGTIASNSPEFLDAFSSAMAQDLRYMKSHGLRVPLWGLQNEPRVDLSHAAKGSNGPAEKRQSYGTCFYSPNDYAAVLKATAPKVREVFPHVIIQAPSQDGAAGEYGAVIRKDPELLKQVDAWTWHQIGRNADAQIDLQAQYMRGAVGKPVFQNEFEYQPWSTVRVDEYFMNTGQALMNWMVFENSPTWFWLHALKPVTNLEATGYSLGFWKPLVKTPANLHTELAPGHWQFNPYNWNAISGFVKYLGWDSTRFTVQEDVVRKDQRILVWRTKMNKLGVAVSNRGKTTFTFRVHTPQVRGWTGHRFTVQHTNVALGLKPGGQQVNITIPPQSFEFWIER